MIAPSIPLTAAHPLDLAIAWMSKRSKLFSPGWGDEALFEQLSSPASYLGETAAISVDWQGPRAHRELMCRDGTFGSPLELLPDATRTVHVRAWSRPGNTMACIMPAASRDEGFRAREHTFGGLTMRGIDLYLLENPFYGRRRITRDTSRISVSDHGMMVLGMVLESRALLGYLRPRYQKLVVAGYSMAGHMAAITAAVTPFPVACAAMATGASAGTVYTRGLLAWSVDLDTLSGAPHLRAAAQQRLCQLFEVAEITRYPAPLRVDAAVIAGCRRDGYVLRSETERLHLHWKGSVLRWIPAGHFSALMTCRRALCDCVTDAAGKL